MALITVPADNDPILQDWAEAVANALNGGPTSSWTPTLTFATPGTLNVVYAIRVGWYYRIGNLVTLGWRVQTSTFTLGTASGNLRITGLPFAPAAVPAMVGAGTGILRGYTKANFTQIMPYIAPSDSSIYVFAGGSAQAIALLVATDTPTGGPVDFIGTAQYLAT